MGQIVNLVALASCLSLVYYITKKVREYAQYKAAMRQHGCEYPRYYPHVDPILGLDLIWDVKRSVERGQYIEDSHQRYEKYGHTYVTKAMGADITNTIEPENLKAMLATDFKKWGFEPLRRDMVASFLGKGILNQDGEYWQHARALIRPTFERAHVGNMSLFRKNVDRLIANIPTDGTTVDLQPLFKRYNLDSSSEFLFGQSVDSQLPERSEENETFLKAFEYISTNMGKMRHLNRLFFLRKDQRWDEAITEVHAFVDARVTQAQEKISTDPKKAPDNEPEKTTKKRFILLQEMAALTDDRLRLRHEILHVFMPGHDSTGTLLASIFFFLARHPEVWSRLRAEVLASTANEITYDTIKNMTYLRYVLNEAIRLQTPFFSGTRIAFEETTLPLGGGPDGKSPIYIPKNQIVALDLRALHRSTALWGKDADDFKPERWETERQGWKYIPFNGGPRVCLGQQLVLMEAGYVIVRLLVHFATIEARDERPWTEDLKLTVKSKYGVLVSLGLA